MGNLRNDWRRTGRFCDAKKKAKKKTRLKGFGRGSLRGEQFAKCSPLHGRKFSTGNKFLLQGGILCNEFSLKA